MKGYKPNLAYIHDTSFGYFAFHAAHSILDTLSGKGIPKGLVVDLGCGSGILAKELVCSGYDILGIDLSPAMIDISKNRVPEAKFITGSFLDLPIPECQAVTSIGECFNYLMDENNSPTKLWELFRKIYSALVPGGLLIFDMSLMGRGKGVVPRILKGDDWWMFIEAKEEPAKKTLTRQIVSFRKKGDLYSQDFEIHSLQLYQSSEILQQLREIGFKVSIIKRYGKMRFPHSYSGYIAQKT
jgi:SAM-dependent methyltransferase